MQNKFTEVANKITTIKTGFAEAITAKGVETLPSASFGDMITNIGNITGGGTVEPEQPIEEWVKPHDWPDIEAEPLEPNEIRMLMCDFFNDGKQTITFIKRTGIRPVQALIDWGDGSAREEVFGDTNMTVTHTFNQANGTPCDRGYNTYVVKIKVESETTAPVGIQFNQAGADSSNLKVGNVLWIYGDFKHITTCSKMFSDHYNSYSKHVFLERVNLINTEKVTNYEYAFCGSQSLQSIPQLNTTSSINMNYMFKGCKMLQEVPELDTSQSTNIDSMFMGCTNLKKIPVIDMVKITTLGASVFTECKSLKSIELRNTSKAARMGRMFFDCISLNKIIGLDTSSVTDMSGMFQNCSLLKEIPQINTSNVTNMSEAFSGCTSLFKTPPIDCSKPTSKYSNYNHFSGCDSLIEVGTITLGKVLK